MWSTSAGGHLMKVVNLTGVCIWFIELPSTQQTIGYNLVYNDMFRLTRVIIRLCSEPLNVLNNCAFWDPKKLTLFTLLIYNYYLNVLWLCVFSAVPIFARNSKTFNSNRNTDHYSSIGTALKTHNHSTFK